MSDEREVLLAVHEDGSRGLCDKEMSMYKAEETDHAHSSAHG